MATAVGQGGAVAPSLAEKQRVSVEVYRLASTAAAGTNATAGDLSALGGSPEIGRMVTIPAGFTAIAFSFLRETGNYDGTANDTPNGVRIGCQEYRPGTGPAYRTELPMLKATEGSCYNFEVKAEAFGDDASPAYVEIIVERPASSSLADNSGSSGDSGGGSGGGTTQPQTIRYSAPDFELSGGYRLETNAAGSTGSILSLIGGEENEQGTASVEFSGLTGRYNIVLSYFDENDGQGRIRLRQNGNLIADILQNQQLGGSTANSDTATSTTLVSVMVEGGDIFEIEGVEQSAPGAGEHARVDYLEFVPQ